MKKLKIAYLGGDSHAGTINDMFQSSLPKHPLVEKVDWEWTSSRWGKHVLDNTPKRYILEHLNEYDLIFQNPWELNKDSNPGLAKLFDDLNLWKRVILYDIADESGWRFEEYRQKCLLYCKRAWEESLMPKESLHNAIPLDFPMFQEYLDVVPMDFYPKRDMAVTCTLPQIDRNLPRGLVVHTVKNTEWESIEGWITQVTLFYSSGWVLSSAATSYRDELTPPAPAINWWYVYMHMLRRTQVLFNAANHSAVGDHRTWEQFASGALVVTNKIAVPSPHLPQPGVHYIPFDIANPESTIKVVKELLRDKVQREKIAKAGLEHAIKYHSSDARVAYVLEEAVKRASAN
jgi:hypothetical protein